ncbi:WD40/YVTN/BNR-like repeat-containing protein [Mucilaginibacter polytrichastri]|uniref:Photosynthesis system II assembly factor Ycf48/Hcf136-like domain-containing protein n=1 Tax=Mucilaginibacter polytrichastri TaxID=1302689 RepID=A0A1Q5ZSQ5_9SPHI|nr:YCF48-related protein [Mucilaginibacter polytrichastri]OKS84805.1 hypothetical protein RG47T_0238 [Mucilaginibacter polytrichastri]SFT00063.1 Uncharacterized protein SAMN04487890_1084 [Mucilaginibacter polytrichastri]
MNYKKVSIIKFITALIYLLIGISAGQAQTVKLLEQTKACSIRGLSVVDNHVAWVSGSNGYVGITTNGGQTWQWQQVKGFDKSDFRDVEAFSDKKAVIMSSGTPALIMQTNDGGTTWQVKYRNDDKAYFLDAMAFVNDKHGYTMGDPIDGKFVLLETKDGGSTWATMPHLPLALPGEAAFAASGTCIGVTKRALQIVTGGSNSRLLTWDGKKWSYQPLPLLHGKDSEGAFSVASNGPNMVFVGGDYQLNNRTDSVAANISNAVLNSPVNPPAGFQSCVSWLDKAIFISTGTPGTNISTDGGMNWELINAESFNVCKQAKHGKLVLLAGDKGKIAVFEPYLPHN